MSKGLPGNPVVMHERFARDVIATAASAQFLRKASQ
jgi:hypothetical protein